MLVPVLRGQRHFVSTQNLADLGIAGRMLLQVKLVEDSFIGVCLGHRGEKFAYDQGLRPLIKLLRDLVEQFGMLVHYLDDVIQVVRKFGHVDAELDESV